MLAPSKIIWGGGGSASPPPPLPTLMIWKGLPGKQEVQRDVSLCKMTVKHDEVNPVKFHLPLSLCQFAMHLHDNSLPTSTASRKERCR